MPGEILMTTMAVMQSGACGQTHAPTDSQRERDKERDREADMIDRL